MILATHALSGAVIGKNLDNVWVIAVVSFVVHFVFDSLRHGEYIKSLKKENTLKNTWWKVGADLLAGFSFVFIFIFWQKPSSIEIRNILLGSFFSIFPDFLTFLYWKLNLKFLKIICDFHHRVHNIFSFPQKRLWNLRNGLNDILISVISIFLLFF